MTQWSPDGRFRSLFAALEAEQAAIRRLPLEELEEELRRAYKTIQAVRHHLAVAAFAPHLPSAGAMLLLEDLTLDDLWPHPSAGDFAETLASIDEMVDIDGHALKTWCRLGAHLADAADVVHRLALCGEEHGDAPLWIWKSLSCSVRAIWRHLEQASRGRASLTHGGNRQSDPRG